ncbi:pol-like protein, partial [Lasius niger]
MALKQFGFRRSRSCIDNLAILQSGIFLGRERKQITSAAFLDVKAAYDGVLIDILMEKLTKLGLSSSILAFVLNLVYVRKVTCRFEGIDEVRWAFRGLPQGSVLSPLLYNIYVAELDRCCLPGCRMIQYADDICIFTSNDNHDNNAIILKNSLANINNKLVELGLSLSLHKTKLCNFDLRTRSTRRVKKVIRIGEMEIKASSDVHFLGMNFTSKLKWNSQINHLWKCCQSPLKIISCLRPEVKEPPLALRREFLCKNFMASVLTQPNHPISVSFESTTFVPEVDLSSGLNFDKEVNCESLFYDFFETEIKETICIYTDGSKTQNSEFAGYAVVNLDENIRLMKRTPNCLSIFTLEALAVKDALTLIEERDLRHVTIFSDSKSVLSAIKNFPSGSRTLSVIYKIKDKLKNMKESGFEVKMIWIPSHCNIIGNELADARAKAAAHQGDEWDGEIPLGDIKSGMKNSLFNKFYEWCEITGKER